MLLRNAMDLLDEGILITDENLVITYVNPAYVHMFQIEDDKIIGEHLHHLFPSLEQSEKIVTQTIMDKEDITNTHVKYHWKGKDMVLKLYTRRFIHEGERFVLTRIFDITDQAHTEEQLVHMIEEMTANIVTIAKGYALLPLQPIIREEQRSILLERVPQQCKEQQVTRLAIQFSGIIAINKEWAVLLKDLMMNLRLLGIEVVLAGMRPQVVMQFTQSGVSIEGVRTFMNIQQATKYFLESGYKPSF